ncbi:FtsW/RodA/SpoVE family cell cycle protein [Flavobacteriales bacterium]|jgi:cell division protein FtsW|nr:FtsW/RodA/SpoVE family cell cycle protein [Flavobacteriales bacterium]
MPNRFADFLNDHLRGDRATWVVAILLVLTSLVSVYSASATLAWKQGGNSVGILFRHGTFLAVGLGFMWAVHRLRFAWFSRLSQLGIHIALGLLLLTVLVGSEINDARRWMDIGGFRFQPSDIAKVALVAFVARMLDRNRLVLHDFHKGVKPIVGYIALTCALILPADFSTAAMLALVCFLMMIIAGVTWKPLAITAGLGAGAAMAVIGLATAMPALFPRMGTWIARATGFLGGRGGSDSSQIDFALQAIHQGGLLPHGPGSSMSRNAMPVAYADMIYAFIIEEWGAIIGGFGLILLYLILFSRAIRIGTRCPKHFGGLLSIGLGLMLTLQALVNMGVAVRLLPMTGQPLPLVSMGGTSIIFTCIAIGMILSVSRSLTDPDAAAPVEPSGSRHTRPLEPSAS